MDGNMYEALYVILSIAFLKAVILGSDFSIYKFIKYGKKYTKQYEEWQNNRP